MSPMLFALPQFLQFEMNTTVAAVFLAIGFLFLIKGGSLLVDGACALASKFSISEIAIGLTVVSFGTSAPELVINVIASIQGNVGITYGNIIGSNIVNILFILGVAGLIMPIRTQKNTVWKEIPMCLTAAVVLFVLCNDLMLGGSKEGVRVLSRGDGIILLVFFAVFIAYIFGITDVQIEHDVSVKEKSGFKIGLYVFLGLVLLFVGGKMTVTGAVEIAYHFKVSETVIGLTIVAIGTSLPELVTSGIAAYKGKNDIAMGNVVGSCIFNIFFIMGISAVIAPLPFNYVLNIDLLVLITASIALFVTMFTGKKRVLDRWEAALLLAGYIGYTAFLVCNSQHG